MRTTTLLLIATLSTCTVPARADTSARSNLFDTGWRFHRGAAEHAAEPAFDDSSWRVVTLPHDYSIEDLSRADQNASKQDKSLRCPFTPLSPSGRDTGFTLGGEAWYRKHFSIPHALKGKHFVVVFGGVYMNADVWINGQHLGNHPYGYTPFSFDITDAIRFDADNVLAVQVKNFGVNSRWYSGSGIYRHVWLKVLAPVHVAQWGTFITTPQVAAKQARVHIATTLKNDSQTNRRVALKTAIFDSHGQHVAENRTQVVLPARAATDVHQDLTVEAPSLWSPDSPVLYVARQEVIAHGQTVDATKTTFGIRTLSFSATQGFKLNGRPLLLKGGCVHHSNGCLGAAAYDRAEWHRVAQLKAAGYNAIRCAHNPPSIAFLDACDRIGMLVIDEAFDQWRQAKKPDDYHLYFDRWWRKDLGAMLRRDRNHPSIILWSIGNEIKEIHHGGGTETAKMLADYVRSLDATRGVTQALNKTKKGAAFDPVFDVLDVCGYNYGVRQYAKDHVRKPQRVMVGTESFDTQMYANWEAVKRYPYVIGDFVWTSYDYLGEAAIGWCLYKNKPPKQSFSPNFKELQQGPPKHSVFPWNVAYCGDLDLLGYPRPSWYYRDVVWNENVPKVYAFVRSPTPTFPEGPPCLRWAFGDVRNSWNWDGYEGKTLTLDVYSNCDRVQLLLNGRSLGTRTLTAQDECRTSWKLPYEKGTVRVVGIRKGQEVAHWELRTAGPPASIRLHADRTRISANGRDLCFVTVDLLDSKGVRCPNANNLVKFTVSGNGKLLAVGSANPRALESFQQPQRRAFQGRCLAVLQASAEPGQIVLTATATGIAARTITITTSRH